MSSEVLVAVVVVALLLNVESSESDEALRYSKVAEVLMTQSAR